MMPRNNQGLLRAGLLLLLAAVLAGGCSRQARYEVLTFFFTGVPPLDWVEPEETETKPAVDPSLAGMSRRERLLAERDRVQAMRPFTGPYVHGPYAADACDQCHEMAAGGFGFGSRASQTQKNIIPGRFVLPPEEICVVCHVSKGNAAAQAAGLRLHGPAWNCVLCHHPHHSREPYFLKVEAGQLCQQCHRPGYIHDAGLHEGLEDCLECHNPHMGRDANMLRDDFQETF